MLEIKETCYKGTRILLGDKKRDIISKMIDTLKLEGFQEISIPIIQFQETFKNKVGEENNNLMFNFKDRGDRDICLAPEYTAIIQKLASTTFKGKKDVKLFYIQECFRGENPQAGRYRQFTQLGVEILNSTKDYNPYLSFLAYHDLLRKIFDKNDFKLHKNVTRGLDYYKEGKGFEITCNELGSSKQICGGGEYDGGIGFAIGIDRLLMLDLYDPLGATVSPVVKGDTINAAEYFYFDGLIKQSKAFEVDVLALQN
ncbi:MAG: Histidine--tRNA ligase [Firmicutes bacterium ADurb.Bin419]|nr:MAG: Histidine--tRNA ligase [Firmicutes bacterium ADurb.Bin419]